MYIFAQGFALGRRAAAGSALFAVALEYLLRTSSAGGGPSKYPWTGEQYLRITPSYESRGKKVERHRGSEMGPGGWRRGRRRGEASVEIKELEKEDRERGQSARWKRRRGRVAEIGEPEEP